MPFGSFPLFVLGRKPTSVGPYPTGVAYRGINRAGAEYGNDWDGWTGQTYYTFPTTGELEAELTYLRGKGFNYVRFPISWERLQHSLNGSLNTSYRDKVIAFVDQCNAAGFRVCIDLHNYGRYATGAFTGDQVDTQSGAYVQRVTGDGTLTFSHWADVWTKIATIFSSYPANMVDYELMNEPHDLPMTSTTFFAGVNTVIAAIRAVDTTHLIMVPNTRGSDMDHWDVYSPGDLVLGAGNGGPKDSVAALAVTDSANNFCFAMHGYQNTTADQWTTKTDVVTTWAQTNNRKLFLSEFGLNNTLTGGETILSNFLTKLNNASDVWLGWTPWNLQTGANNYNVTSTSSYTVDGPAMPWYQNFLTPYVPIEEPPPEDEDSFPTDPATYTANTRLTLNSGTSDYWVIVPPSYNSAHTVPTRLFVWLHGCGGEGFWDVYNVAPGGDRSWIAMAVGGRETLCWQQTNSNIVLNAIAHVKTKFNIHPRQIVLGGYSSGGDLGYLVAFQNSTLFAGVLFQNTDPFLISWTGTYDSANYYASATYKFNVAHLAQTGDTTYPIATVTNSMNLLDAAGYDTTLISQPGLHWDGNTISYLQTYLLPYLDAGWERPGSGGAPPASPVVHLKSTVGVTETSWYVNTWSDQSGSGNNFTANIEANPVQRLTGAFDGATKPSVYFPDWGTGLMRLTGGITFNSGFSAFVVFKTQGADTTSSYSGNPPMTILGHSTGSVWMGFGLNGGLTAAQVEYRYYAGGWQTLTSTGLNLNNGVVHTIAVTHDTDGTVKLYADGVQVGINSFAYNTSNTNIDSIGTGYLGQDQALDLNLAEVKMFNAAISASEVSSLHSAALAEWT